MRKYKKDRPVLWKKMTILGLTIALAISVFTFWFKWQIGPNIDAVSRQKAKGIITEIINETIEEQFSGENYENFFVIEKDGDGNIKSVMADTAKVNRLISGFAVSLQKKYDDIKPRELKLPYGSLVGSKLLSASNFNVGIKILPMSVAKCDYETEFDGEGINQTKYKIYVNIESTARILQPFSASDIKVKDRMLVAEVIILGDVPENYVMVPKDSILDAIE